MSTGGRAAPDRPSAVAPSRRSVLRVAGVAGLAAAGRAIPAVAADGPEGTLPVPALLTPTRDGDRSVYAMDLRRGTRQLVPGVTSPTAGFNGPYLGPTIRLNRGEKVRMRLTNRLGEDVSVHWHGAHVPPSVDGGPQNTFAAGSSWSPEFTVLQQAATLWYHPHTLGVSARQVASGLVGMLIVADAAAEAVLPCTYGVDDLPLILQSQAVGADGVPRYNLIGMSDPHNTYALLVNGRNVSRQPATFRTPARRVRLRLLNASLADVITVARDDGAPLVLVATDNGLLPGPIDVTEVRLAAAERAEVVVDLDDTASLVAHVTPGYNVILGMRADRRVLQLSTTGRGPEPADLPATLNTIPRWDVSGLVPRPIRFTDFPPGRPGINGVSAMTVKELVATAFDVRLGATEVWRISNDSPLPHSFHLHDVPFQVLAVNGAPPTGPLTGWKDTIDLPLRTVVDVTMRFTDFADEQYLYLLHCHVMEHEDEGMMAAFRVVRP